MSSPRAPTVALGRAAVEGRPLQVRIAAPKVSPDVQLQFSTVLHELCTQEMSLVLRKGPDMLRTAVTKAHATCLSPDLRVPQA